MKIFRAKKNNIISKFLKVSLTLVLAIIITSTAFATDQVPCTGFDTATHTPTPNGCDPTIHADSGSTTPKADSGSTTPGVTINSGIKNPLGPGFTDLKSFIEGVLNFFLLIGIPIITLAIIYSGFLFVTAQGNSEKLKKAKQTLIYTLVGAALLLGCFVITHAIQGTVDQLKS